MRVYVRGDERWEIAVDGAKLVERLIAGGSVDETVREASSPTAAKWYLDRRCRQQIAAGFERESGSDDIAAPSEGELLAAIRANPDDLDVYPVFGDYMSEHGDPWGELVAVQHARATLPRRTPAARRDELDRRDAMLQFNHAARLWGRLGEIIINESTQTYAYNLIDATWFCGFLRTAKLGWPGNRLDPRVSWEELAALLQRLPRLEIAAVLRTVEITSAIWPDGVLEGFARGPWPQLEGFSVTHQAFEVQPLQAGRIAAVLDGVSAPKLQRLHVENAVDLTALCEALAASPVAPQLTTLRLWGEFTDAAVATLERAPFAALATLNLAGPGLPDDSHARLAHRARSIHVRPQPRAHERDIEA